MSTAHPPIGALASRQASLHGFNQTAHPFPEQATLHGLFEEQVARDGSAVAVLCDHDQTFGVPALTYAELNSRANQLAYRLRSLGVGPDSVVGLLMERSFSMMIGLLGILKAGGAYLPIAPDHPAERILYLLADAGVRILLVQPKTAQLVVFGGETLDLADLDLYQGSGENLPALSQPTDLAYVIYTSGSTGRPKGVMVEHRSVVNRLHWMQCAYPLSAGDVILQKTPYYFDVSVWEFFWWGMVGAAVCFLRPGGEKLPLVMVETIQRHRVTVLHFVPSMLHVFLEYLNGRDDATLARLSSLRRVFASGEALSPGHVRRFHHLLGGTRETKLTNLYGPTEATVDVTYFDADDAELDRIPIGRPIHNTRLYILQNDEEAPLGVPGELCLGGVGVARGYLNNPELTAAKFTPHPQLPGEKIYRTGDIARWLSDGNVEYLGREDQQVKIRGLRIELGEIENTLCQFPGVLNCVVTVKRFSESVVLIVAYVVEQVELSRTVLRDYLKGQLPEYMVPSHFVHIDEIPLTPTGKVDRKALPDPEIIKK